MSEYPPPITASGHIEAAPRRVRGLLADRMVFDTTAAVYVWEWPWYPQYYIPIEDIVSELLVDEHRVQHLRGTPTQVHELRVGDVRRPGAARLVPPDGEGLLQGRVRFDWDALDSWFEEDEEIFVHPRNPYTRVDALRSTRTIRVEVDGVVLAESSSPVLVFETGLPTRYYLNPTQVRFEHLTSSTTETACPYKGKTSGYWNGRIGGNEIADLAWTYHFPTRDLLPMAGLICFYNEKVDTFVDGTLETRPTTHLVR
jgi:uncharacterized protein (DUF427 family)